MVSDYQPTISWAGLNDVIVPPSSVLVRSHLEQCPALGSPMQDGHGTAGVRPKEATKML